MPTRSGNALRWERSRNDELFPHLYGELDLGAVTAILDMRARSDGYPRHSGACAVIRAFDAFSLPLLRWFDPEDAHRMAIQGLRLLPPMRPRPDDSKLAVRAFGLNFPNPIGMAAGFDKSAEAPDALLRLGFGFVEIGSVTPQTAEPAIRGRGCFAWSATRPSSTAWVSTMTARKPCCGGSPRARILAASSASMSGPTRIRPTASPITSS